MAEWLLNKKPKPRPIHEPIIIPKWYATPYGYGRVHDKQQKNAFKKDGFPYKVVKTEEEAITWHRILKARSSVGVDRVFYPERKEK